MTTLRRILITTVAAAGISGVASADIIVGYQNTIGPSNTDITNATVTLPSFDPGSTNSMASNISGNGYTTGISMSSLDTPMTSYTLVGYNITVKETLTGSYTVTNTTSSTLTGTIFIDTYTAVALNGALAPPLTAATDPANDLYNCGSTGVGTSPCTASGEQTTSLGGGPDPNSTVNSGFSLNAGQSQTFAVNTNSKWVDLGCELQLNAASSPGFCNENLANQALDGPNSQGQPGELFTGLNNVETGVPNLTFFLSSDTQTDQSTSGGNFTSTYATQVKEQVTVSYDFTETSTSGTPEPTTMALIGGGLLGLGLLGKRFKKS